MQFGLVFPLWNLMDGPRELLQRAVGEIGIDHLTVPAVTGPLTQFRLCGDLPHPTFSTEGGWHYPPGRDGYAVCGVRPHAAHWFGRRDLLAQLRDEAVRRGLRLFMRLDLRAVAPRAEQQRHLCPRNAWGDELPAAGACVSHPELRELLRATLADLQRYEPAGFELVDWAPSLPVDRGHARPLAWDETVRALLDLCFCPACREIALGAADADRTDAGRLPLDPDAAARSVRVHVQRLLSSAGDGAARTNAERDPLLAEYCRAVAADSHAWLSRLRERYAGGRCLLTLDVAAAGTSQTGFSACGWELELRCGQRDAGALERLQAAAVGGGASACSLWVWQPLFAEAAELVRRVTGLAEAGVRFFDFEGLEQSPPQVVDWLRQAVRYARRG